MGVLDAIDRLNDVVFLWLNASSEPSPAERIMLYGLAEGPILLFPLICILFWARGPAETRRATWLVLLAVPLALLLGLLIALFWPQPRPFVRGIGQQWMTHTADHSFPSDHMTLMCAAASGWLTASRTRVAAVCMFLFAILMGAARIRLGLHYPTDLIGGWLTGLAAVGLLLGFGARLLEVSLVYAQRLEYRMIQYIRSKSRPLR